MSDLFVVTARLALDEVGDPTDARGVLDEPAQIARRPHNRRQRVAWAASQVIAHADDPARGYRALRELVAALYEPVTGAKPARGAPAPEVALTLAPAELLAALAPVPRVLCSELARAAKLDARALLGDPLPAQRILGVRALTPAAAGRIARDIAAAIVDRDAGVRGEALALALDTQPTARTAIVGALREHATTAAAVARSDERAAARSVAAAITALRGLRAELAPAQIAAWLGDPDPAIRAAAAHAAGAEVGELLVARLADGDREVRTAALGAIARIPALHTRALVAPLSAIIVGGDDTRTAVYVLGKLRADPAVVPALQACVRGPRSDVATAAAMMLRELGADVPEIAVDDRVERAASELSGRVPDAIDSGVLEARRLGVHAEPLIPALRRIANDHALAREVLVGLGADPGEPTGWLESHRGIAPSEAERHGAYVIARLSSGQDTAMGMWDGSTGRLLIAVGAAKLLALVPGRAELAALREVGGRQPWSFERFTVPTGEPLGTLAIPEILAYGTPAQLAIAGGLATIWCDDRAAPYRFHVKLGDPDRLLDDKPVPGRRSRS